MSQKDLIAVLFLCMPLVLCAGVWLGMRISAEQERIRREDDIRELRRMATDQFLTHGPMDARGAAIWDTGSWLNEHRMP